VMFTPYIGFMLLKVKPHAHGERGHEVFDSPAYRRFRRIVTWCVEWRKTTIALTLGVFALGIFGFTFIEKQFFPDSSRPELMVELWSPEGTSFAANEATVKRFEAFLAKQQGVQSVTSYVASTCHWTRSSRSRTSRRWSCCRLTPTRAKRCA
jgi:multidrug efflux pump